MQLTKLALATLAIAGLSGCMHSAPSLASCPSANAASVEVAKTMRDMYEALKADDLQAFHDVTTKDFYAFDVGKRFDGDALMSLVKAAHERGAVYDWNVNDPMAEAACNTALVTYINTGSITEAGSTRALSWLESATLIHDGQRWRIRFFHSTRVPQP